MIQSEATKYFGLGLIDTGNLVHSAIVSGEIWEAIGGKMRESMDYKVWTADGQSDRLQVLGIGELWPIYLEGMKECFLLEPLVIQGLSHSVNLRISFLMGHNLKINSKEKEVALRSVKDGSTSRAQLVDGRYHSFISKKTGRVLKTMEEQMILSQAWRIPEIRSASTH